MKNSAIKKCCCCFSVTNSWLTPCDPMDCTTPGFPVLYHLPELAHIMSIESLMPSNHLILSCPLLLLPSSFPSIRVFSNEDEKYWSFSFSISHFNEYSGLISFRINWLDLLDVKGTLKNLFQHYNLKALFFGA